MHEDRVPPRLRDVLDGVAAKLKMARAADTARVWGRWRDIVGETMAAHVEPTSLRDGVLRVRADSPVWATEAGYLAGDIASLVNQTVGRPVVREVRVWTGPHRPSPAARRPRREAVPPPAQDPPAGPQEALERARRAWARRRSDGAGR